MSKKLRRRSKKLQNMSSEHKICSKKLQNMSSEHKICSKKHQNMSKKLRWSIKIKVRRIKMHVMNVKKL